MWPVGMGLMRIGQFGTYGVVVDTVMRPVGIWQSWRWDLAEWEWRWDLQACSGYGDGICEDVADMKMRLLGLWWIQRWGL